MAITRVPPLRFASGENKSNTGHMSPDNFNQDKQGRQIACKEYTFNIIMQRYNMIACTV